MRTLKPFLKWAGGKRWLVERELFIAPEYNGRYIEPFVGGGAMFFSLQPKHALLSDINTRLIESYQVIRDELEELIHLLTLHHRLHSHAYYYQIRRNTPLRRVERAAQFIYLNRTCWNGLYRENLRGEFNVPIGTKSKVFDPEEDLHSISLSLQGIDIVVCDFENTINQAEDGDFVFADPPYTTAHNFNGFVKYNERVFAWADQVRLRDAALAATARGAKVVITNAYHPSVIELYDGVANIEEVRRQSVISGQSRGRTMTSECLIWM